MPKKEEIKEKNNKVNKEKISKKATVLEETKKTKTEKKAINEVEKKITKKSESKAEKKDVKTKSASGRAKETPKKATKTSKISPKETSKKETTKSAQKKEVKKTTRKKELIEDKKVEEKIDELSVIEKIKSFIAKIAAMQEEAKKEVQAEEVDKNNKKNTKKTKTEKEVKKIEYMLEYYDLPYRYNETVVKILAQTPKRMFVYWDISDNDREKYIEIFGKDFFDKTYPVLLLYNEDKKYIKEIVINDFANSWYIDIPDSKTKYSIQLGRKFKQYDDIVKLNIQKVQENKIIMHTDYLPFANSNILEVPNDHVLLENLPSFVTFRNVKTNEEKVVELKVMENAYKNQDIKGFYEKYYKDEITEGMFDMANPSSNLSSSSFK